MYTGGVNFTWDEAKRQANIAKHGLDFAEARKVFAGPMILFQDDRNDYGEQRMTMRKADSDETDIYYQNVGYF